MDKTRVIYRQGKTLLVAWIPEGGELQTYIECDDDLALVEGIAALLSDLEAVVQVLLVEIRKAK